MSITLSATELATSCLPLVFVAASAAPGPTRLGWSHLICHGPQGFAPRARGGILPHPEDKDNRRSAPNDYSWNPRLHREPAVDPDHVSGHVARPVAREEGRDVRDLLR